MDNGIGGLKERREGIEGKGGGIGAGRGVDGREALT